MVSSPIRCAGGKRKLAPGILALMPTRVTQYYEPFLGGGAVFFALASRQVLGEAAHLADVDSNLIALYTEVRDQPTALVDETDRLIRRAQAAADPKAYYHKVRDEWNAAAGEPGAFVQSVRQLFLRRACWNGLWRVNMKGHMNVPWRGEPPKELDWEVLRDASGALQGVHLSTASFSQLEPSVKSGTVIYADSPYLVDGGFVKYAAGGWEACDMIALLQRCAYWSEAGATVILSHADTKQTRAYLAEHWPRAEIQSILARRNINSDGTKRGPVPEILAWNGKRP